jgi:hypothetical protein
VGIVSKLCTQPSSSLIQAVTRSLRWQDIISTAIVCYRFGHGHGFGERKKRTETHSTNVSLSDTKTAIPAYLIRRRICVLQYILSLAEEADPMSTPNLVYDVLRYRPPILPSRVIVRPDTKTRVCNANEMLILSRYRPTWCHP